MGKERKLDLVAWGSGREGLTRCLRKSFCFLVGLGGRGRHWIMVVIVIVIVILVREQFRNTEIMLSFGNSTD